MGLLHIFLIALGLSADAFAVAICLGLSAQKSKAKSAITVGLYFGLFQGVMPILGFMAASQFSGAIDAYGHIIAFAVLVIIGGKMIWESFKKDGGNVGENSLRPAKMISLAVATSIDALMVGASFAFLQVNIIPAAVLIGVTTFTLSTIGFGIGGVCGSKLQARANLVGGIILVLIGIHVLIF